MKRVVIFVIGALCCAAAGITLLYFFLPERKQDHDKKVALESLLARHANFEEVTNTLQLNFIDYSVGSPNRWGLDKWLRDERPTALIPVREGVVQYPRIYFHTTMWTMTWLFFDGDGKLQKYYLCAQ